MRLRRGYALITSGRTTASPIVGVDHSECAPEPCCLGSKQWGGLRVAKLKEGAIVSLKSAPCAEGRFHLGEVDGAEVRWHGVAFLGVTYAVHQARAVDAVVDAVHVQDL